MPATVDDYKAHHSHAICTAEQASSEIRNHARSVYLVVRINNCTPWGL